MLNYATIRLSRCAAGKKCWEKGFCVFRFCGWTLMVTVAIKKSCVFNSRSVLSNRECFIKMRAAFLNDSRKDGGGRKSAINHLHFDVTLSLWSDTTVFSITLQLFFHVKSCIRFQDRPWHMTKGCGWKWVWSSAGGFLAFVMVGIATEDREATQ